ncbi:Hypothetical protein PHPALM_37126 [Phytophthora palmivora]|uniref:ATP-binding cassette (ABC) Superfamily n=1 Tax=Phytophthora palmivora TaxID=4796 RepID=A0A2P4WY78_9STRA|nr:Hypothetical protein PHPALM_37126 [Phytophthora palmivora]
MFLEHLKAPRGLNHGRTSRDVYESASVQDEPLFVNDIEAARCVLLASHQIPSKEFSSLRKKPEDRGGLFPVWGYPWVQPENPTTQSQTEDLFWRWISLKNFTVQELKELREDRLLSYVLDQRDLRIEFAHLIAKRQLHSVMEGLRHAHDERGYGSVNPGIVHSKAAKKPRTTYPPPVIVSDPRSQQPSGSQPRAGLQAPTSSATRGNPPLHKQLVLSRAPPLLDDPLHMVVELAGPIKEGRRSSRTRLCYEASSQPHPFGPSTSSRASVGSLLSDEIRHLRDRVYAIGIALRIGPGGQAAAQADNPGALEVLRQDVDDIGRATRELR